MDDVKDESSSSETSLVVRRRHKRRRQESRSAPVRQPVWWCSEALFKTNYLTRAIDRGRHEHVREFALSGDLACQHLNERDRQGRSPFHAAMLAGDPHSLLLLMCVKDEDNDNSSVSNINEDMVPTPAAIETDGGCTTPLLPPPAEETFMHVGLAYDSLPGFHLGLAAPHDSEIALCYILLLRNRLLSNVAPADASKSPAEDNDQALVAQLLGQVEAMVAEESRVQQKEALINQCVYAHCDVDVLDAEGHTLLDRAALAGDLKLCMILVSAGAVLGESLACAVHSHDIPTFMYLLKAFERKGQLERQDVLRCLKTAIQALEWRAVPPLLLRCELSTAEFEALADYADMLSVSSEWVSLVDKSLADLGNERSLQDGTTVISPPVTGARQCAIFTHRGCLDHLPLEPTDNPVNQRVLLENPHRLEVLLHPSNGALMHAKYHTASPHYIWVEETGLACMQDVLRVHDIGYVHGLMELAKSASPHLKLNELAAQAKLDSDTLVTQKSFEAALSAAEAVISAVKGVCTGEYWNAFCCIRPPGHHVGTFGSCQDDSGSGEFIDRQLGSQGFCLLNNVAIGAAWARYNMYDRGIRRIAIVDFDIHHGNGTEAIVRNLVARPRVLYNMSMNNSAIKVSLEVPMDRSWRNSSLSGSGADAEEVMLVSIHGYDGRFYPGMGAEDVSETVLNVAIGPTVDREGYLEAFRTRVLGPLVRFRPDLILLSAGFDGHMSDSVSGGAFARLKEADYRTMTESLQSVANFCCAGRLVSVLEGGYNTLLGRASPFARCVAAHLDALGTTHGYIHYDAPPDDDDDERDDP